VEQFQKRQGRAVFADLQGKGGRTRTVPIPERCALRIRQWIKTAGVESGPLLRPVDKADQIANRGMTTSAIKGGAKIDHETPDKRRFAAVQK